MIGRDKTTPAERRRAHFYAVIGIFALLAAWVAIWGFAGSLIIPPPWDTLRGAVALLSLPHTWGQILTTLVRVALGFALALVSGSAVGVASGRVRALELALRPVTLFLQGIPPLLWVIPLVLLFGIGHLSPVMVIALICFPLVAVNVAEGVKSVPKPLEEMADIYAPGVIPRYKEVVLPHLRPFLSATLDLGFALGLKASVVGEFFGANNGIGFRIQAAYQSLQIQKLFAWGLVLVLLIILSSHAVSRLAHFLKLLRKGPEGRPRPAGTPLGGGKRKYPATHPAGAESRDGRGDAETPLDVRGVSFGYPGSGLLFEGIDLTVGPDEVAVISGDSGIGKTTLLKLVAGILAPTSGSVSRPRRIGFVFQDDRLLPWQTALKNTALPLRHGDGGSELRKMADSLAAALLEEFGLGDEWDKYPEELSGGMRKRAAFARCFARDPGLILLDEPFSGLHREARGQLWARFLRILERRRLPVVVVTHYPEELEGDGKLTRYTLAGNPARIAYLGGRRQAGSGRRGGGREGDSRR